MFQHMYCLWIAEGHLFQENLQVTFIKCTALDVAIIFDNIVIECSSYLHRELGRRP